MWIAIASNHSIIVVLAKCSKRVLFNRQAHHNHTLRKYPIKSNSAMPPLEFLSFTALTIASTPSLEKWLSLHT